ESGDRAVDQARIEDHERSRAEAVAVERAGLVVLNQHVRLRRHSADDLLPLGAGDVDGDRPLPAVGADEVGGLAALLAEPGRAPPARVVARAGPLDLDHLRSEVGEHLGRPRSCQDAAQIEDADARAHRLPSWNHTPLAHPRGHRGTEDASLTHMANWIPFVIVALLVLAGGALLVRAWVRRARLRKRVPVRRVPHLRHPIVLAHGVFGFDEIAVAGRRHRYFRNIAEELTVPGLEFYRPRVAPTAPISVRAGTLVKLLRSLPGDRFNVIAHSMGGLDARFAIARLGLADRIASLVTIGAPHHGTPLADAPFARATARLLGVAALADLAPDALERFNHAVPDVAGVAYCSVVAASDLSETNPLLWPTHLYLSAHGGRNDGIVPQESQRWGKVLREIEADHWAQGGWSLRFDAVPLYEEILRELAGLGF